MPDRALDARSNLRPLRLRAMLTQEELALKAGVGTRSIRDIELGKVRPQPKTLRLLAEALGLEAEERALLTGAPERSAAVPRELPRALTGFAGRQRPVDELLTAVAEGAAVVAVHGMAGVGKTSLAVQVAHVLAPRYPDGQLFIDLHGFAVGPRPGLASVLTRVLRGLGAAESALPADVDELTVRYRSAIADRRVLLVFDNAASADQLEALLPGTPGSLVLATSRRDLSALTDAHSVPLEVPPLPEAVAMLSAAADGRITDDEAAAVAERCGRLPLAMGLAAGRLRSRPLWGAADLLWRLADEDRLLDVLDTGHRGVAAALRTSYGELDADHQRLFRLIGVVPGDDVDARAAAVLCEVGEEQASAMLESLVDVHLVETRSAGRYRLHDLVRLFAAKLAEETEDDLDGAFSRLLGLYLHYTYQAASLIASAYQRIFTEEAKKFDIGLPGLTDHEGASTWYRVERDNLAAAVFAAERQGRLESAWHLATAFSAFRLHDRDVELHLAVNGTALDIARRLGDEQKVAHSLGDRGRHLIVAGRREESIGCLDQAAALEQKLGDIGAATLALRNIGLLHRQSGRFTEALDVYRSALALAETASDGAALMLINSNMIVPLLRLGRLADAGHCLAEAERLMDADDDYSVGRIENFHGTFAREHGDPVKALSIHTSCFERCRQRGLQEGFTPVLIELGEDLLHLGRGAEAIAHLNRAVEHAEGLAYPSDERSARNGLGRALTASGRPEAAVAEHERAAALAESHEDPYEAARAHHGLADAYGRMGDAGAELRHARLAARGYAGCGVPEAAELEGRVERLRSAAGTPQD
ncbi:ATP-binding protein [Glycomyces harbinensis]|uniref:Predicted ATPase n=1 Tax=Glycomyces harbinensis TaxID=58114 RepID=A0A1G7BDG5_9ACTN|nr:tetratricopeptide repeat protein [Glycomyces harbinensis]SDE25063.1 Predicted ATPase [Glycomyces harbinensis]